jgi:hypothetical protein
VAALPATSAVADTKLTMEELVVVAQPGSSAPAQETRTQSTLWFREDRAARVAPGSRIVTRLSLGESYLINDAEKTATILDFNGLPEDLAAAPRIVKTGETRAIGGWDAERYELTLDTGGLSGTITLWISADVAVQMEVYRAFSKSLDGAAGSGLMTAIASLPGYPVLQEADLGIVKSTGRLLAVDEEPAPAGLYEVPADYERR